MKKDCIQPDVLCFQNIRCLIKGITSDQIQTLAVVHGQIILNDNVSLNQSFHIVPSNFPISCDGVLGNDFLTKYNYKLDFSNFTIQIFQNQTPVHLSLQNSSIVVPGRSEKLLYLQVPFPDGEFICKSSEIVPGVYIANSITQSVNGVTKVSLLNEISNYNIFPISTWENKIQDRLKSLENEIEISDLNHEEKESVLNLCREYNDIFYLPGDKLSTTNGTTHSITTPDKTKPIHLKPYRLPESAKNEINDQIRKMLEEEVIESSKSPWNFPLLIVPKKSQDGSKKWRVVVDFRKLNEITVGDVFPIPNISEILDQLGKSQYFTTLDLANGYHQVLLDDTDKEKIAFSSNLGHFQFRRMPFGLKNAPSTFQRLMNSVLAGLQGIKCFVYLDDVVVYGCNLHDHNHKLQQIFQCFREANLKLHPQKCIFLKQEISY